MTTVNHECYVSLEVAKLLKQAGFKWFINSAYRDGVLMHQGNLLCDNFNGKQYENAARHEFFSAPTLDVAQRWLREVKGYNVLVCHDFKWNKYAWWILQDNDLLCHNYATLFDTYEEAQETGIKNALEIILEKKRKNENYGGEL